ncbi:MAG: hypothetical protein JRN15_19335 [Nitrososphaerota archaeon]|nr:hypothetical protein [Nitrososphaerota archaeon]
MSWFDNEKGAYMDLTLLHGGTNPYRYCNYQDQTLEQLFHSKVEFGVNVGRHED